MQKSNLFILFVFLVFSLNIFAQQGNGFEGIIKIMKTNKTDTVYLTFQIKAGKVRIDEFNQAHKKEKYTIVDINIPQIIFLKPDKKIYTKISAYRLKADLDTNTQIIKTGNYKYILGEKCFQWRLKIPALNTEITYWVVSEKYIIFNKILSLMDSDIAGKYFLSIEGHENVFPMLVVERSMLREWKSQIEVLEIKNTSINNHIFEIPGDYKFFQK